VNYLARSSLAAAAPTLKSALNMTTQQYSWVVASFQAAYTVMQPVAGWILDLVGVRLGFALFAVAWSLANGLHALATSWQGLAGFRGLLGLTEAAAIPAALKVVAEWFPARERTVATGWFNIGTSFGGMLAPPLVIGCIYLWGWQSAFLVTGVLGLLWALLWYTCYRSPEEHPRVSSGEREWILEGREAAITGSTSWREVLRQRDFWSIAIPRFLAEPAWQTFNFFIPLYLFSRGMDLKAIAAFAWLPFLAADAGSICGGYLAPFVQRRWGFGLLGSRQFVVAVGAVFMIGPACIGLSATPGVAIALFCIGGFAHQMLSGALLTLASDLFDRRSVATVAGLGGAAAWIGGLGFSLVVGGLADRIGYDPLFVCLALFDLVGAALLWTLQRHRRAA
jgi:ACS family hexuronate transporter-like MFS transporter